MGHRVGNFRRSSGVCGGGERDRTRRLGSCYRKKTHSQSVLPFSQASRSHLELNYPKTKDGGAGNHNFQLPGLNINCRKLSTKFDFKSPRKHSVSPHPASPFLKQRTSVVLSHPSCYCLWEKRQLIL